MLWFTKVCTLSMLVDVAVHRYPPSHLLFFHFKLTFYTMFISPVLFQERSSKPDESRHLICNTCGSHFHGIAVPTRKKLLSSACGEEVAASLQRGSFLVASRANSERPLSNNFPALVEALFKLKRAHWKYGVYFVFSFGVPDVDDVEGESKVFALNLTRLMDGSSDHPIPDEVLNQQQALCSMYDGEMEVCDAVDGGSKLSFPRVNITHHNGGPVKWSSYRSGMCVVYKEIHSLEELLRQRGFVSDSTAAERTGDPAAVFLTSFLLIPLSSESCFVMGKFSVVVDLVQSIRHLFADGEEIGLFSFSGYAEWTKAQLLREIARGSWGVVRPEVALVACAEIISPSFSIDEKENDDDCMSAYPSVDELSSAAQVASYSLLQSSVASDDPAPSQQHDQQHEHYSKDRSKSHGGKSRSFSDVDGKAAACEVDEGDEDELPPIPQAARARAATRGSMTRARAASNGLAQCGAAAAPCSGDPPSGSHKVGFSIWSEMFLEMDEGNIWDKMINISMESDDNVIRRSYN